ncbi:hypothetical protein MNV49_005339 [Pseudohyphozyma bogoriensis]|nr:hypothetical protein MNV49_005339 [Pseudohyphozyma bogoriensis]
MHFTTALTALLLSSAPALALPRAPSWSSEASVNDFAALKEFATPSHWSAGGSNNYTADDSCDITQKRLIGDGLSEALTLLDHARAHLRRFGNDTIFTDWFGKDADPNTALGLYDRLVDGDKSNLVFRCDDVSNLCNSSTYGVIPGYFVPTDKDQTVVCPTYFNKKPELQNMCNQGQTLVKNGSELTQGAWFVHRLLHTPTASGGRLSDVVDTVAEALELAAGVNQTQALYSIHSVQYYALDTYAFDILLPGVGCRGDPSTVGKRDYTTHPRHITY